MKNDEKIGVDRKMTEEFTVGIYPTAKTLEQIEQDDKERQETYRSRLTKIPRFKISIFISIIFGLVFLFLTSLRGLWSLGSLPSVILSYLYGLVLLFLIIGWAKYTSNIFYSYGRNAALFYLVYFLIFAITSSVYSTMLGQDRLYLIISASLVNFIATYLVLLPLLKTK